MVVLTTLDWTTRAADKSETRFHKYMSSVYVPGHSIAFGGAATTATAAAVAAVAAVAGAVTGAIAVMYRAGGS